MVTAEFNASAVDAGVFWTNRSDMESLWPFLFFGGVKPVVLSPHDSKVQELSRFVVGQYNLKKLRPFAYKLVRVIAAKVVREYYHVTFEMGATKCRSSTRDPDICPLDQGKLRICEDVIMWVRDYRERKIEVTAFANCQD